jgi:hypothetical protein
MLHIPITSLVGFLARPSLDNWSKLYDHICGLNMVETWAFPLMLGMCVPCPRIREDLAKSMLSLRVVLLSPSGWSEV